MEQLNIFDFMLRCLLVGCARPAGQTDFELCVYVACCIFNVARIITYVPTIKILLKPGCTGDGQSLATWMMWIAANGTMALHITTVRSKPQQNQLLSGWWCFGCVVTALQGA